MPKAAPNPLFVKVTFNHPLRSEQDITNALDMAEFPAEVRSIPDPARLVAFAESFLAWTAQIRSINRSLPGMEAREREARAALNLPPL